MWACSARGGASSLAMSDDCVLVSVMVMLDAPWYHVVPSRRFSVCPALKWTWNVAFFCAAVLARHSRVTCNDVVGDSDNGGTCRLVSSSCCERYSVVDLCEEEIDGSWWVPLAPHSVEVPVEFGLCDGPLCGM
jgi:hypothetical protein